jgi:lambda family phage portal protein
MGIFDLFKSNKADQTPTGKVFKRSYAAASTGRLFGDFSGSPLSSDAELKNALPKLRERARDLARNNEYARKYFSLLRNNVVGDSGFQLQVKALDSVGNLDQSGNDAVERSFKAWAKRGNCTVDGKMSWVDAQKLAIESIARDGEVFIVKHRSSKFKDSFALEFIEPDQVDHTLNKKLDGGREIRMGVELDEFRRPSAYYVLTRHPGDNEYALTLAEKYRRIPADKMIHAYMHQRAGQTRGEPWLSSAIDSLKQLGALREASVINARIGASKMGFFTSPAGDGFTADEMDGDVPIMSVEPGTFHQLPQGVDFKAFDPDYPTSEFDSFHKSVLKGIAAGMGVSYSALSNDLESTSYSSIRQGALEERDNYRNMQNFLIEQVIMPIYEAWLSSSMEMNTFGIPFRQYERFLGASNFRGRSWSWVDPAKEMNAAITGLKAGVLSLSDVAAQYGKDVEDLVSQIARDRDIAAQFDVKYALEPYGANMTPITPDGFDDPNSQV